MQSLMYNLKNERGETIAALAEGGVLALLQAGVVTLVLTPTSTSPLPVEATHTANREFQLSGIWGDLSEMRVQLGKLNSALRTCKTTSSKANRRLRLDSSGLGVVVGRLKPTLPPSAASHYPPTASHAAHLREVASEIDSQLYDVHDPDDGSTL